MPRALVVAAVVLVAAGCVPVVAGAAMASNGVPARRNELPACDEACNLDACGCVLKCPDLDTGQSCNVRCIDARSACLKQCARWTYQSKSMF